MFGIFSFEMNGLVESSRRGRWSSRRGDISDFFIGEADRSSGLVLGPVREERLTNESRSRAEAEGNSDGDGNSGRQSMRSKTWTRCDYSQQDSKVHDTPHIFISNTRPEASPGYCKKSNNMCDFSTHPACLPLRGKSNDPPRASPPSRALG
jgi:hypothetical protein